ncbi:hypothetical protein L1857_04880 [Amycolatopsis thermalba]|uniref:Integral membrane protein n=1 Tax=Amycolatopsis thermalba TaxID=944492 RepID=A0ABY4NQV8_9PSEU|nr:MULTISPECIES: hypothetical protein [Amycolatopsis]UQS22202.1 hypothetical protein L1857_04880 [Amycolatopsis thermalba]
MTAGNESDDERRAQGLPPAPSLPGDEVERPDPPKPVQVSFWFWVASAVVLVIAYLVVFLSRQQVIDVLVKANTDPQITPDKISSGTTVLFAMLLVGSVSFAAFFVLFAWKARQGTRSARTVLTVLVAITLVFQFVMQAYTGISLIATLLCLVALVLMYIPSVQPYFPKVGRR